VFGTYKVHKHAFPIKHAPVPYSKTSDMGRQDPGEFKGPSYEPEVGIVSPLVIGAIWVGRVVDNEVDAEERARRMDCVGGRREDRGGLLNIFAFSFVLHYC
jgi:hypothetical protein